MVLLIRRLAAAALVSLARVGAWALHLEMSDPRPNLAGTEQPTERNEHHGSN